ncbi:MAG: GNAT family N-acetyltransferase [Henriciella sp.]|nr:GNAT family N-acetyltransferase [Henriciella sp.]
MTSALIQTERLELTPLSLSDASDIRDYYVENAAHLDPWEPARNADFHTLEAWRGRIRTAETELETGQALKLVMRRKNEQPIIGVCNFTNIVRGPFQACTLGYSIAAPAQGSGLMHEALSAAIQHMFDHHRLHRIMANYLPENERSAHLLQRLGFKIEGRAKSYLHIAGAWRDHILTARINEDY